MSLTVVIGGARSGKSSLALELAAAFGDAVTFVATGEARDAEMAARIDVHRRERPEGWATVEEPLDLQGAIERTVDGVLVVDCLSLWAANMLERHEAADVERAAADAAEAALARTHATIVVTNEVGLGIVPATELGRAYRDLLGRVNSTWVGASERTLFVVAGHAIELKAPA